MLAPDLASPQVLRVVRALVESERAGGAAAAAIDAIDADAAG